MSKSWLVAGLLLVSAVPALADALPFCTVRVNLSEPASDPRHRRGSTDVYLGDHQYERFEGPDYNWVGAYIGDRYFKQARKLAARLDRDGVCSYREPWWVFSSDGAGALGPYVGRHTVVSRQCQQNDAICEGTAVVVLDYVGGVAYRIQEIDASGHSTERMLEEKIAYPRSAVFRTIVDSAYWCRYDVDAAGTILRADSVTFERDWRTHVLGFESRVTTTLPGSMGEYYVRSYKFAD